MTTLLRAWFTALLLLAASAAQAEVQAQLDRDEVALDETVTLILRASAALTTANPQLDPLERDFEVLSTRRNSQFVMRNGQSESWTEWSIDLAPRRSGVLTIPAIEVGGKRSEPLTLTVTQARNVPGAGSDVFLEVEVDRDEVYVQAQLLLTIRLYHSVNLGRGTDLPHPQFDNAIVEQLEDRSYAKLIDGQRFGVYERRYAVFPQQSGSLTVEPLLLQATVEAGRRSWFDPGGTRGLRAWSPAKTVTVLPTPVDHSDPHWLPASQLTLVETWDREPEALLPGQSATRTVTLRAAGLLGSQLPDLTEQAIDGLKLYPDRAEVQHAERDGGIVGERVERSAVMPVAAGRYTLPEIRVPWWNVARQRREVAVIPARTITVLAAAENPIDPTPLRIDPTPLSPPAAPPLAWWWPAALIGLALAWLVSTWRWWVWRRRCTAPAADRPSDRGERSLRAELLAACARHDAADAYRLLPRWGAAWSGDPSVNSLERLLARTADDAFTAAARELQRALYAGATADTGWRGDDLAHSLRGLAARRETAPAGHDSDLPPLYAP